MRPRISDALEPGVPLERRVHFEITQIAAAACLIEDDLVDRECPRSSSRTARRNRSSLWRIACSDSRRKPIDLQVRADAGQQFLGAERLDQVVVGPGFQAFDRLSSPARADSMMTGRPLVRGSAPQCFHQAEAVELGIITSVRIRSGGCSSASRELLRRRARPRPGNGPKAGGRRTAACRRCRRPPERAAGRLCPRLASAMSVRIAVVRRAAARAGPIATSRSCVGKPAQRLFDERAGPRCPVAASVRSPPICSGGRCSFPAGSKIAKVVPCPRAALGA